MTLEEFLREIRTQVQSEIEERLKVSGTAYPFPESVFAEIVMQHMAEVGMTFEPEPSRTTMCSLRSAMRGAVRSRKARWGREPEQWPSALKEESGRRRENSLPSWVGTRSAFWCRRILGACSPFRAPPLVRNWGAITCARTFPSRGAGQITETVRS